MHSTWDNAACSLHTLGVEQYTLSDPVCRLKQAIPNLGYRIHGCSCRKSDRLCNKRALIRCKRDRLRCVPNRICSKRALVHTESTSFSTDASSFPAESTAK